MGGSQRPTQSWQLSHATSPYNKKGWHEAQGEGSGLDLPAAEHRAVQPSLSSDGQRLSVVPLCSRQHPALCWDLSPWQRSPRPGAAADSGHPWEPGGWVAETWGIQPRAAPVG